MNTVQKRLSVVGITVLLISFASVPMYSQTLSAGERLVFYLDSNSHVHALFAPSGSGWTDVDINVTSDEVPVAAAGSALTSFVDNSDVIHVYYLETSRQIEELDISGINSFGFVGSFGSPTSLSGAPLAVAGSALTAFVDPSSGSSNITHLFYLGTNGTNENVYEVYLSAGVYHFDDPTTLARGPVATSGSALTSFIDAGVMHVFYLGTNDNVYELYWNGGTAWHSDDPTSLGGAPIAQTVGSLTSFVDGGGTMHVFYLSGNNVHELYWNGGSAWHTDDPTTLAGAPLNATGSALTSFFTCCGEDPGMHIMYLGTNEHVYAISSTSLTSWGSFDATGVSGDVLAANGSKLTSFQDTLTEGSRLYFTGNNDHIYELYWPFEGSASETDLTVASSSGATAASGTSLSGVMEPN